MARPAGVIASAVVTFLGSALALLLGGIMVAMSQVPSRAPSAVVAVVGVVFVAFAALGIWTGIDLLHLRPWARASILVFGGFLAATSAISAVAVALMPGDPAVNVQQQATLSALRPVLVAVYLIPFSIGVWWLVYFTRPRARAAFAAAPEPGAPPPRPLAISIVGWFAIAGAVISLASAVTGWPAFLAGYVVTGGAAALVFVGFGAISLYLGWGLLKLDERARRLAIAWSGLTIAHAVYVALVPGARARIADLQRALPFPMRTDAAFESTQMMIHGSLLGVVVGAAVIWVLIRHRPAFSSAR